MRTIKFISAIVIPICVLVFLWSLRTEFWDKWFGIDEVEKVVKNFELSYSPDASHPVRAGDPAWKPMMRLIHKYSAIELPKEREPKVIARSVAVFSQKLDIGAGKISEWTSPATPVILLYKDWPGQSVPPQDYRVVGTIGDLRLWINQSRDDFRFIMQDVLLSALSITLGIMIWVGEHFSQHRK